MLPAHQRLAARKDRHIRPDIELRLVIHHELFLGDRRAEVLDQLFLVKLLFMERAVVNADPLCVAAAHLVRSHLRPVETPLDL